MPCFSGVENFFNSLSWIDSAGVSFLKALVNLPDGVVAAESPPNRAKMPHFFGLLSSNLTSSKLSPRTVHSSILTGGDSLVNLSKLGRVERPSSCNEGLEGSMIGDRAEISNDRRYPSHDSRGIVNGSSIDVRSMGESDFPPFRFQKLFFSVGEGGRYTPLSLTTLNLYSPANSSSLPRIIERAFPSVPVGLSEPFESKLVDRERGEYGLPKIDPAYISLDFAEVFKCSVVVVVELEANDSVDLVNWSVGVT